MDTTTTAPGWYDDGTGRARWWDGVAWTAHVAAEPAAGPAVVAESAPQAGDPRFGTFPGYGAATAVAEAPTYASSGQPGTGRTAQASGGLRGQLSPRFEGVALLALGLMFAAPVLAGVFSLVLGPLPGASFGLGAVVFAVLGAIIGGNGVGALAGGEQAPRVSWILVGVGLVLLVAMFALGFFGTPSSSRTAAQPAPTPVATAAAPGVASPLPKGFTSIGDAGGYKVLPRSATTCAANRSCRSVQLVSAAPCRSLTALVEFGTASGRWLGSDVVEVSPVTAGTAVTIRAVIARKGATQAVVSNLVCDPA